MKDTIHKGLLQYAVSQHMVCAGCHQALDTDSAVLITLQFANGKERDFINCASCYDRAADKVQQVAESTGTTLEIIDGRALKTVRSVS